MIYPLIGMPQGAEWLVILAIVVLVFGAAKLPELARGTGQALRIFKTETKAMRDDEDEKPAPTTTVELPATPVAPVTPAAPTVPAAPAEPIVAADLEPETRTDKHPG